MVRWHKTTLIRELIGFSGILVSAADALKILSGALQRQCKEIQSSVFVVVLIFWSCVLEGTGSLLTFLAVSHTITIQISNYNQVDYLYWSQRSISCVFKSSCVFICANVCTSMIHAVPGLWAPNQEYFLFSYTWVWLRHTRHMTTLSSKWRNIISLVLS